VTYRYELAGFMVSPLSYASNQRLMSFCGGQGRYFMTDEHDDPWIDRDFDHAVRETAYFLWEQAGRPAGREQEFWFEALQRSLRQRQADRDLQIAPRDGELG
jgi:hypothetical protein